jgi:hypothetical protein
MVSLMNESKPDVMLQALRWLEGKYRLSLPGVSTVSDDLWSCTPSSKKREFSRLRRDGRIAVHVDVMVDLTVPVGKTMEDRALSLFHQVQHLINSGSPEVDVDRKALEDYLLFRRESS